MLEYVHKKGPQLILFRPVEDLSHLNQMKGKNEFEDNVISGRNGLVFLFFNYKVLCAQTILKVDFWPSEFLTSTVVGAPNYRQISGFNVFTTAQPTTTGMKNILDSLISPKSSIVWINLREEPMVYINAKPYVLRDKYFTLRNIKSYSGITPSRLELLEKRLKADVINELEFYDGKILLHEEESEMVKGLWTTVRPEDVMTFHELIDIQGNIEYHRIPITSESKPEEAEFESLLKIVCSANPKSFFVINCQIGIGRSVYGSIIVILGILWTRGKRSCDISKDVPQMEEPLNYQVIHSLLRVIRNGLECKQTVDWIINICGIHSNIRNNIEIYRKKSENETGDSRKRYIKRAVDSLKRYFMIIAFQSYLDQRNPDCIDSVGSFVEWMNKHQEFNSMLNEINEYSLFPVGYLEPGDGVALSNEVASVVNSRHGSVLYRQMILKHDHFPGCQKLSLKERIEGGPNFRWVDTKSLNIDCTIYGVAMPTTKAVELILEKVGSGKNGNNILLWTSLREEPVIYVNGNPYVLRTWNDALKNLEATGIEVTRVERMEDQMKKDVLEEMEKYGQKVLLHEEECKGGSYSLIPIWESVKAEDVLTPREVFEKLKTNYKVEYMRIPITDEQAPIPTVFDQLYNRITKMMEKENISILFNCQMGRGRTTSGMVIATMMFLVKNGFDMGSCPNDNSLILSTFSNNSISEEVKQTFINGEYKVILQLVSVLQYGKIAKHLADMAIDSCAHIQNIRSAIYDYKIRVESLESLKSIKESVLFRVGENYLVRYFYLVTFANYLLERNCKSEFSSFNDWLDERREITTIVDHQLIDFS
jgi:protein-tyrosine phosphatase